MGKSRRSIWLIALLVGMMILAVGCSKKKSDGKQDEASAEATMFVGADQSLTVTYIDTFDKDYYNLDELKAKAVAELSEFHGEQGGSASLESAEVENGKVKMVLKFTNMATYLQYVKECEDSQSQAVMFEGTVSEAKKAGYSLDVNYTKKKSEDSIGIDEIEALDSLRVIVLNTIECVKVEGEILYVHGGTWNGDAVTTESVESVILYSNK